MKRSRRKVKAMVAPDCKVVDVTGDLCLVRRQFVRPRMACKFAKWWGRRVTDWREGS